MKLDIHLNDIQPPTDAWDYRPDWWPTGADNAAEVIQHLLQRIEALEAMTDTKPCPGCECCLETGQPVDGSRPPCTSTK